MFEKIKESIDQMNEDYEILKGLGLLDEDYEADVDPEADDITELPDGREVEVVEEDDETVVVKPDGETDLNATDDPDKLNDVATESFSFFEEDEVDPEDDETEPLQEGPFVKNLDKNSEKILGKISKAFKKVDDKGFNPTISIKRISQSQLKKLQKQRYLFCSFLITSNIAANVAVAVSTKNKEDLYYSVEIVDDSGAVKKGYIVKSSLSLSELKSYLSVQNLKKVYNEAYEAFLEDDEAETDDTKDTETSKETDDTKDTETVKEEDEVDPEDDEAEPLQEGPFMTNIDKKNGTYKLSKRVNGYVNRLTNKSGLKKAETKVQKISEDEYNRLIMKRTAVALFPTAIAGFTIGAVSSLVLGPVGSVVGLPACFGTGVAIGNKLSSDAKNNREFYFEILVKVTSNDGLKKAAVILVKSSIGKSEIEKAINMSNIKKYNEAFNCFDEDFDNFGTTNQFLENGFIISVSEQLLFSENDEENQETKQDEEENDITTESYSFFEDDEENQEDLEQLEEANFSFLPRFKEKPELKDLYKACTEAESLLALDGESLNTGGEKFGKVALRILDLYYNISSAVIIPSCLLLAPIPSYLITRLIEWGIQEGKEAVAKSYARKAEMKYRTLANKEEDNKKKEEFLLRADNIHEKITKLNLSEDYEADVDPESDDITELPDGRKVEVVEEDEDVSSDDNEETETTLESLLFEEDEEDVVITPDGETDLNATDDPDKLNDVAESYSFFEDDEVVDDEETPEEDED